MMMVFVWKAGVFGARVVPVVMRSFTDGGSSALRRVLSAHGRAAGCRFPELQPVANEQETDLRSRGDALHQLRARPFLRNFPKFLVIGLVVFSSGAIGACSKLKIRNPFSGANTDIGRNSESDKARANIQSLTDVIKVNGKNAQAYNLRGVAYGTTKQHRSALSDFSRAISLDPHFAAAYANRALIHLEKGKVDAAFTDFNRSLKANPDYVGGYIGRGAILRKRGKLKEALADFNRALSIDSNRSVSYHNRALVFQGMDAHTRSIEDFTTAISLLPTSSESYNGRGLSLLFRGRLEKALDDFTDAVNLRPDYVEAWNNRAYTLERLGNYNDALESYQAVLVRDRKNHVAREGLQRLRSRV